MFSPVHTHILSIRIEISMSIWHELHYLLIEYIGIARQTKWNENVTFFLYSPVFLPSANEREIFLFYFHVTSFLRVEKASTRQDYNRTSRHVVYKTRVHWGPSNRVSRGHLDQESVLIKRGSNYNPIGCYLLGREQKSSFNTY